MKQYETVFILTPVLSEQQMKDTVERYKSFLLDNGAEIVNDESWGLKNLAYPIQKKTTGFYHLFEYKIDPAIIAKLNTEFVRDETVMRYLVTALDKYAIEYNEKRRKGFPKKEKATA